MSITPQRCFCLDYRSTDLKIANESTDEQTDRDKGLSGGHACKLWRVHHEKAISRITWFDDHRRSRSNTNPHKIEGRQAHGYRGIRG